MYIKTMNTWISLLRGINVGGKNVIKMDALIHLYEKLGFKDARSYLQSGNVIFRSDEEDPVNIGNLITTRLKMDFGMEVSVFALSPGTLEKILENNPFLKNPSKDPVHQYITFLFSEVERHELNIFGDAMREGEDIVVSKSAVYLFLPGGYGRTRLSNNFLENKLEVSATTRSLKTAYSILHQSIEL